MAEAHDRAEWNRAAMIAAVIVNVNIDPKKTNPVTPARFSPYTAEDAEREHVETVNDETKRIIDAEIARRESAPKS